MSSIRRAWAAGKLHHATLLAGPSGVGKTMVARETARLLLCDAPGPEPDGCGRCRACGLIDRGAHPDLILVDVIEGKKQISVAQVRELRARLEYPPHRERGRAVIFERAEAMTTEAQNALLKTLEEPTDRTYLILTTSHPSQLLPTIRSRCSDLNLAPLPTEVVLDLLRRELPAADPPLIRLAASLSSGSVTTAKALAEADLDELADLVERFDQTLEARQVPEALDLTEQLARDRNRLTTALQLLALWYRDVMRSAAGLDHAGDGSALAFGHRAEAIGRRAAGLGVVGACDHLEATLNAVEVLGSRNANARLTAETMMLRMIS